MHLQVKYGLITILNQNLELCDYAGQVDLTCPLDKGDLTFEKVVNLPKEIPQVCSPFVSISLALLFFFF